MNNIVNIRNVIAEPFYDVHKAIREHKYTHFWLKGGRYSTKSSFASIEIILGMMKDPTCDAVVLRKVGETLSDSVYNQLIWAIEKLDVSYAWEYKKIPLKLVYKPTNQEIIFRSANNKEDYKKIKSTKSKKGHFGFVWYEEVDEFSSYGEIRSINQSLMRGGRCMIFYTYNPPKNANSWVNVETKVKKDNTLVHHSNYLGVPKSWIGEDALKEAEELKKRNELAYRHEYLGEVIGLNGLIYNCDLIEYVSERYIEDNKLKVLYLDFSIDGGHQISATTYGCYALCSDGYFYLLDLYYYSPNNKTVKKAPSELSLDLFEFERTMITKWKAMIDKETIDSAEGALRNQFFADYGKRLHPVDKGKDKEELIDFSHSFLNKKRFRVLDTPNNQIFKKEMSNYQYKEGTVEKGKPVPDKTEQELPSDEIYYNSHSKNYSYFYADHTCDKFQYWVKDNLQKLGLKF